MYRDVIKTVLYAIGKKVQYHTFSVEKIACLGRIINICTYIYICTFNNRIKDFRKFTQNQIRL